MKADASTGDTSLSSEELEVLLPLTELTRDEMRRWLDRWTVFWGISYAKRGSFQEAYPPERRSSKQDELDRYRKHTLIDIGILHQGILDLETYTATELKARSQTILLQREIEKRQSILDYQPAP